ncbi:amino acid racemase [Arcanobacterium hippocoleae]
MRTLVKLDCEVVCVPCVTSHAAYAAMLTAANPAQVIDFPQEIAQDVKNRGCVNIGILATSGTVKTGFLQRVMENSGLCAVIPDPQIQSCVDSVIYDDIKAGKTADPQKVQEIICAMKAQGCDSLVLGCTELPLMRLELDADGKYAGMYISDSLKVLAKAALRECGLPIKAGK